MLKEETYYDTDNDYFERSEQDSPVWTRCLHGTGGPELKKMLTDISQYDNIVVAGPCWWGTYPMGIFTQIDALDFIGKKVFGVMTQEGSGQAGSEKDLKKYCKGAVIGKGLAVHGGSVASARAEVASWAKANLK